MKNINKSGGEQFFEDVKNKYTSLTKVEGGYIDNESRLKNRIIKTYDSQVKPRLESEGGPQRYDVMAGEFANYLANSAHENFSYLTHVSTKERQTKNFLQLPIIGNLYDVIYVKHFRRNLGGTLVPNYSNLTKEQYKTNFSEIVGDVFEMDSESLNKRQNDFKKTTSAKDKGADGENRKAAQADDAKEDAYRPSSAVKNPVAKTGERPTSRDHS